MKVEIDAGGRSVTLECDSTNTTPEAVIKLALDAWDHTAGAEHPSAGPATGLNVASPRFQDPVSPFGMSWYGNPGAPEVVR